MERIPCWSTCTDHGGKQPIWHASDRTKDSFLMSKFRRRKNSPPFKSENQPSRMCCILSARQAILHTSASPILKCGRIRTGKATYGFPSCMCISTETELFISSTTHTNQDLSQIGGCLSDSGACSFTLLCSRNKTAASAAIAVLPQLRCNHSGCIVTSELRI